jgi:nitronate monooxygenase
MKVPPLKIGNITAKVPIIQGGMGVRVSMSNLAAAVSNEGGIGTIASVGLGDVEKSKQDFERVSREALEQVIRQTKQLTDRPFAVNIMAALSNFKDLVKTSVREGIKMIVSGAGLPLKLPGDVDDDSVNLLPIVSSGRAATLILRTWDKRFQTTADGIILEGPLAGGHLGFSYEQLQTPEKYSLEKLLPEVLEAVKPFEDKYGKKIPVIAAGGLFFGKDIVRMLKLGASGVQMATRFVGTRECDVHDNFKQAYLNAKAEDIEIIKSPVGMPARAIKNKFLKDLEVQGKIPIQCYYRCLIACKVSEARYCIAKRLVNSCEGRTDEGVIFCGSNAHLIDRIVTVKELMAELVREIQAA